MSAWPTEPIDGKPLVRYSHDGRTWSREMPATSGRTRWVEYSFEHADGVIEPLLVEQWWNFHPQVGGPVQIIHYYPHDADMRPYMAGGAE